MIGDPLDLDAIKEKWLRVCGTCDAGVGECSHPAEDYRTTMLDLVVEIEQMKRGEPTRNLILHSKGYRLALEDILKDIEQWWTVEGYGEDYHTALEHVKSSVNDSLRDVNRTLEILT